MVRSWVIVVVLAALVAAVIVQRTAFRAPDGTIWNPPAPPAAVPTGAQAVVPGKALTGADLTAALENGRPTLVDFGAGTCTVCKQEAPVLDQAAAKYAGKANVVYVDVNTYEVFAKHYKVQLIPTQISFDAKGKEVTRHVGFHSLEAIGADLAKAGMR